MYSLHEAATDACNLGFYTLTYRLGYREKFDVKIDGLTDRICDIETREDPENSATTIAEIRAAAKRTTHMSVSGLAKEPLLTVCIVPRTTSCQVEAWVPVDS